MFRARDLYQIGLPRPLTLFWKLNVLLWFVCEISVQVCKRLLHWTYPYDSPFFKWNHFIDFYDFQTRFHHYHHLDFFAIGRDFGSMFSYPPPAALIYEFFYLPGWRVHSVFTVFTMVPIIALCYLLARAMISEGISKPAAILFVASTIFLSFPLWIDYLLGNIEICIFILVAFAILAMLRGNLTLSAVLIGIAGSMKIFPFLFLGLFLSRKQYRQFALGFITAAVLYPIATWMECPSFTVAQQGMKRGADAISNALILKWHWEETRFDHSLFGLFKQTMHLLGFRNERSVHELHIYVVAAAIAGTALYFFRIRHLPWLNQLLCLTIASVLLPPMSHDYTLMYLYLPWGFLALSEIRRVKADQIDSAHRNTQDCSTAPGRTAIVGAFICFAILFSPQSEIIIGHAAIAGQIKAVILVVLWYIALKEPFLLPWPEHELNNRQAAPQRDDLRVRNQVELQR